VNRLILSLRKKFDRMTLFSIMGLVSTVALALPVITLIFTRLAWYKSLPALFFYYLGSLSTNLVTLGYIPASKEVAFYLGTITNFLDAPLILLFLSYFSQTAAFRKKLITGILILVAYEILIVAIFGFSIRTSTMILGPGLLAILMLSIIFFIHQVKIAVVHQKAIGKAIMISSILTAYAGFIFLYTVYYLIETPYKNDARLIFFMITIITSIPLAIGIVFERKRVQQLTELQTTREELKAIYGDEELSPGPSSSSFDSIVFKLDKN
jgi:hypothetical protein